ncbi:hypothetical protein HK103_002606 [Boothiomyces macroporosus]|uniref:Ribosomal protein L16 n=1 Tax=Boothiomyces macroporosus TaxID=261099 RepID=A0AAD5Y2G6_9FUNG|nr:hypothetical protein HK103_002606 [Boothiomyces macroporosus]
MITPGLEENEIKLEKEFDGGEYQDVPMAIQLTKATHQSDSRLYVAFPKKNFNNQKMFNLRVKLFQPTFSQIRTAVANYRPKKLKNKKAFKGIFRSPTDSIKSTTVYFGDYGLQAIEGGRLSDKQMDVVRQALRRFLKQEKTASLIMRVFPDRPVTAKPLEVRMGKGKGPVDYFAQWIAEGRVLFEVKGARPELAEKALDIAKQFLPIRTRIVKKDEMRMAPRVLPSFILNRLKENEYQQKIKELK